LSTIRRAAGLAASVLLVGSVFAQEDLKEYRIDHQGSLQDIDKGDLRWQMALGELRGRKHLFALGVVAKTGGEIMVWNSVPLVTTVQNGQAKTRVTWERDAAFLAWTQVAEWHPVPLPATVKSLSDLAAFIPKAAAGFMLDLGRPIPFRLEGTFDSIASHVFAPPQLTSPASEKATPVRTDLRVENVQAEIFGLFSEKAKDFIPRGDTLYMQVKSQDGRIMGRVDSLEQPREATLYLPR
jgi:acetolactate decarboxylase